MNAPAVFTSDAISDKSIFKKMLVGNAKILFDRWKYYASTNVWKNEHLLDSCFLFGCGTLLTTGNGTINSTATGKFGDYSCVKYLENGKYNTVRMNPNDIQDSGSGKTEVEKDIEEVITRIGCKGSFEKETSDSGLLGTIRFVKNKSEHTPGLLQKMHYVIWDEGSVLFNPNPPHYKAGIPSTIQMALDEPFGKINKTLAAGTVSFETHSSILTSSFITPEFQRVTLTTGVFQRMCLSIHEVTNPERRDYQVNKHKLAAIPGWERDKRLDDFVNDWKNLVKPKRDLKEGWSGKCRVVMLSETIAKEFSDNIWLPKYDALSSLFEDGSQKNKIFQTFLSRQNQLYHTAAIVCALNGKSNVEIQELEIGLAIYLRHLWGAYQLIIREDSKETEVPSEENLLEKLRQIIRNYSKQNVITFDTLFTKWPMSKGGNNVKLMRGLLDSLVGENFIEVAKNSEINTLNDDEIVALNLISKRLASSYVYRLIKVV